MGRGFFSGLIWGAVVSVLVVGMASVLSAPPGAESLVSSAPEETVTENQVEATTTGEEAPAPSETVERAPEPTPEPEPAPAEIIATPAPQADPAPEAAADDPAARDQTAEAQRATVSGELDLPAGSEFNRNRPEVIPEIPDQGESVTPGTASSVQRPEPEAAPAPDTTTAVVAAPVDQVPSGLGDPAAVASEGPRLAAVEEERGRLAPPAPSLPAPVGTGASIPVDLPTDPLPPAQAAEVEVSEPEIATLAPQPEVNRLPTIGGAEPEPEVEAEAVVPDDEAGDAANTDEVPDPATLGALARNAAPFEPNESGLPYLAVVLIDVGSEGMDRETLTTFSFPVAFAIDPLATDASAAASAYRDAGQEVLILAEGLPRGATPQDVEVVLGEYLQVLPQAMGVVDTADDGFQTNRDLINQVVDILSESGHGLLTYDRGLNAAQQIAAREGVPATLIFRELDAARENSETIKRYLDRAAFRAGQEGTVVMIGRSYPETVTALFAWALEARSQSVSLVPLSAVMRGGG